MEAADSQIHGESREMHLRKQQLAATVRKIQWSYAIFWSISSSQPGFDLFCRILAWTDGYYNGEIKTRKTTQPSFEINSDHIGLQRSEELRELYESLSLSSSSSSSSSSAGDSNNLHQIRRPSASLSPEDLTDTEWYYLVCMSFTFTVGQGLPGGAYSKNRYVWLNNARFVDSKIFSRSLLAMSASIQTVLCIPFMDGVLEFGTTELILEDPAFAKQTTSLLLPELPVPVCSEQSVNDHHQPMIPGDGIDNSMALEDETKEEGSPVDGLNFVHDEFFSDCLDGSLNSNEYASLLSTDGVRDGGDDDDLHYVRTLARVLLCNSKQGKPVSCFWKLSHNSSFIAWRSGSISTKKPFAGGAPPQKLLKKIIINGESNFLEAEAGEDGRIGGGVDVTFDGKQVQVVMHCPWRECLLLEIVESMGNFHLDPVSMQSSIDGDGVLAMTITSKFRGSSTVASPGMIKRSLQRVIRTRR